MSKRTPNSSQSSLIKGLHQSNNSISNTDINKKIKTLTKTLHKEELSQLQSFLVSRSEKLDRDIENYKKKLKITGKNDKRLQEAMQHGIKGVGYDSVEVIGQKLDPFLVDMDNHDNNRIRTDNQRNTHHRDNHSSKQDFNDHSSHHSHRKSSAVLLKTLFHRMTLKMKDLNMHGSELRELLLPTDVISAESSVALSSDTHLPLHEVVDVLQVDLLLPITDDDQMAILDHYGNSDNLEVDIHRFLLDAGTWDDLNQDKKKKIHQQYDNDREIENELSSSTEMKENNRSMDVLDRSTKHVDILHDLHQLVIEESQDLGKASHSLDDPSNSSPFQSLTHDKPSNTIHLHSTDTIHSDHSFDKLLHRRDKHMDKRMESVKDGNREKEDDEEEDELKRLSEADSEYYRLKELEAENKKLKTELNAFDSEFFEQLEDLKYKYKKLQEVTAMDDDNIRDLSSDIHTAYPRPLPPEEDDEEDDEERRKDILWKDNAKYPSRSIMDYTRLEGPYGSRAIKSSHHTDTYNPKDYKIGTKNMNTIGIDSLSNACERRLAFEIFNSSHSTEILARLTHKVKDIALRNPLGEYISAIDLVSVIRGLQLNSLSDKEIIFLAKGFASDGIGGIAANEFIDAIRGLVYELKHKSDFEQESQREQALQTEAARTEEDRIDKLIEEICMGIISHDRKGLLAATNSLYEAIVQPFHDVDIERTGSVSFDEFVDIIRRLGGVTFSDLDMKRISQRFEARGKLRKFNRSKRIQNRIIDDSEDDVSKLYDRALKGSIKGTAKVDRTYDQWLPSSWRDDINRDDIDQDSIDDMEVDYEAFVKRLEEILDILLERQDGLDSGLTGYDRRILSKGPKNSSSLLLKEFELIDLLLTQLELMPSSDRRRCLTSLHYSFTSADTKNEGELDGFAILQCLLNNGFKLQRINRVRLLRAIEEIGGKFQWSELFGILLRSCADWTHEERGVVKKILHAMGISVVERRAWIIKLRNHLVRAHNHLQDKVSKKRINLHPITLSYDGQANEPGVPPSTFLHILRDLDVKLTVEEEAILLDCLDLERMAEIHSYTHNSLTHPSGDRLSNKITQNHSYWSAPMIYYKSFIAFCSRHCGHWTDMFPELKVVLEDGIREITRPIEAFEEFTSILLSFDELEEGFITQRAFLIACHRCRLLHHISESDLTILADALHEQGGGKIKYRDFLVYIRSVLSSFDSILSSDRSTKDHRNHRSNIKNKNKPSVQDIFHQLIDNSTDSRGSLMPLRAWLLKRTVANTEDNITENVLRALLRDFNVLYDKESLVELKRLLSISNKHDQNAEYLEDMSIGMFYSVTKLLQQLLTTRGRWIERLSELAQHIVKLLTLQGKRHMGETNVTNNQFPRTNRGIETAYARKVLARLRAFTCLSNEDLDSQNKSLKSKLSTNILNHYEGRMIERDIFAQVVHSMGLSLSNEEILLLADATDPNPRAEYIRIDVITEALVSVFHSTTASTTTLSSETSPSMLQEKSIEAMNHVRELLWRVAKNHNRTTEEWQADVMTLIKGFDTGLHSVTILSRHGQSLSEDMETGFITTEDFTLALALLNATVSQDILRHIPMIPDGPGLIHYKPLLRQLLIPPSPSHSTTYSSSTFHENSSVNQKNESTNTKGHSNISNHSKLDKGKNSSDSLSKLSPNSETKNEPLKQLLHIIRKSLSSFLISDTQVEEAWIVLLQAFSPFDPHETNHVSPRDFCLAVSLLLEGDEVVFTKEEWLEVIQALIDMKDKITTTATTIKSKNTQDINYMVFCELVLDPKEVKALRLNMKSTPKPSLSSVRKPITTSQTTTSMDSYGKSRDRNRKSSVPGKDVELTVTGKQSSLTMNERSKSVLSTNSHSSSVSKGFYEELYSRPSTNSSERQSRRENSDTKSLNSRNMGFGVAKTVGQSSRISARVSAAASGTGSSRKAKTSF